VFVDKTDAPERLVFQYDDAELALMFGKLDVTGPDGKKITEKTAIDNLPLPVAAWVAKCYREWENSQLLFRWNGVAGMAAGGVGWGGGGRRLTSTRIGRWHCTNGASGTMSCPRRAGLMIRTNF